MTASSSISPASPWPGRIIYAALGFLLLLSFCADFENTLNSGAIDLRNRIIGVRLLAHHIDPYFYKWHFSEPTEYCDPYNNPKTPTSQTTATPTCLLLHWPFAQAPYRLGQFLWFFAQWFLFIACALLWRRGLPASRQRLLLALFAVGLTYTAAWRLHLERGQAYLPLLFLFACWLRATLHDKWGNHFLTGFLAGFLVSLRPTFALIGPFLALHRRGQLLGAGAGLLVGLGLPMLWEPGCWMAYASAMQIDSHLYRTYAYSLAPFDVPNFIEGAHLQTVMANLPIPFADTSVHALLRRFGWEPVPAVPVFLLGAVPFAVWLWWSRRRQTETVLLGLAAWIFLIDFFLPAYRNSYNDVMILNVFALGLIVAPKSAPPLVACGFGLVTGWVLDFCVLHHHWPINVPTLFFALGAVLFLFVQPTKNESSWRE